jgi:PAS domain S-box-containing protein
VQPSTSANEQDVNARTGEASGNRTVRALLVRQHELIEETDLARRRLLAEVAERTQAEARLREREAQYRLLFEQSIDGVFIADAHGRYVDVSPAGCAMFGMVRDEFLARSITDLLAPEEHHRLPAQIERLSDGQVHSNEWRFRRTDGSVFVGELSGRQLPDGRMQGVVRDITERKRAEEALRQSEERFRSLVSVIADVTWATDADGQFTQPQEAYSRYTGKSWEELRGSGWISCIHPDDRPKLMETWTRAVATRTLYDAPCREWHGQTQQWRHVVARGTPVLNPDGSVREWVGTLTDVHDQRMALEALRESEEALREADRRKDEFLAMLAHELRNPLAPIRTGLELIRLARNSAASVERVRTTMERQVGHMVRLIDDLLDVSRITSGKIQLQRTPTPLVDLLNSAIEANRSVLDAARIQLRVHVVDQSCLLDVDPTRMVQVVSNLLHNAGKFTLPGGHVDVSSRCTMPTIDTDGELELTVADDGIGISPEMLLRVFDLFTQGEQRKGGTQPGLGIGLALARRLIEMHGGRIEATSKGLDQGSAFTIHLPITRGIAVDDSPQSDFAVQAETRRVVVIDDNEDAARTMAMLIEELGSETRIAHDGETGLKAIAEFRPDVVLLDIGMPGIDGYETCRQIRVEPFGSDLVVVALTGWGQEQDKSRAAEAGFDAHITKPADPAVLERILAAPRQRKVP